MAVTPNVPGRAGAGADTGTAPPDEPSPPSLVSPLPPSVPAHGPLQPDPRYRRRGALVGVILGAVTASALMMAVFIWYRAHAVREPTTAVIVEGNAALDGAEITVSGSRVITTRLSAANNYVAPVLLEPGRYWVTAEHRGRELLRAEVEVKRFLGVRIKLPGVEGATPPAPAAARAGPPQPTGPSSRNASYENP